MNKVRIREEARFYFVPFLLGDNQASHRLSKKIYKKYGIVSFILDKKRTAADIWDLSSRFLKLINTENQELITLQLIDLAEQSPYTLPLLIPCSEEHELLVKKDRELLETRFVISSENLLLTDSPLKIIP